MVEAVTVSQYEAPKAIAGLSEAELGEVQALFNVWGQKRERNLLRSVYYEGKAPLRSLGIAIPPNMSRLEAVLEWPAKAVRGLALRSIWDGFVAPGAEQDPFELQDILDANRFDIELPQAIVSAYKHSCSFISTTRGDVQSGEPEVIIMPRSAEWSAAIWDRNKRVLRSALAITDADKESRPTSFVLYLPEAVLTCVKSASGRWSSSRQRNPLNQVLVEPLTYDPQLDRPFGRSRISRPVMSITDRAARTLVRSELHAEFFSSPQRLILGANEQAWEGTDRWRAYLGRFLALTRDEDGEVPKVEQLSQQSMQPHLDQFRQLAGEFAGATGLAISSLGVVHDNPASAEAIYAEEKDLIVEARASNRVLGAAIKRVGQRAVMIRDNSTTMSEDLRRLKSNWLNPAFTSPVTSADALVKLSAVFPWLGDSEVALEMAGFTAADITRLLSDKQRAQGPAVLSTLAALTAQQPAAPGSEVPANDEQA